MSDKKLNFVLAKYKNEIQKIVQVGAHEGQEIPIFEKYNFEKIYLFEPNDTPFQILEKKVEDKSNYKIFKFALGNKNSKEEMYYSTENQGQSSSFLAPEVHKKVQPNIKFQERRIVEIKKFEDLNINNIDFLIMDVQGFELEVLKGFGRKINELEFIFTEVNRDYLYSNNVLIWDLDKYLNRLGFVRTWTSWRTADMPWGDAFYLKSSNISKFKTKYFLLKNLLLTSSLFFYLYKVLDFRIYKKRLKNILKS